MLPTLPVAKAESQAKLCCGEIDIGRAGGNYAGMEDDASDLDAKLYIAEWLAVFGMRRRELAEQSGVSEPYISQLANNKKENPSREKLKQIAGALGITVKDLYSLPPPREVIEAIQKLPPGLSSRIQQRRKVS
jgi:predicted XRE-type DNA-binding protein